MENGKNRQKDDAPQSTAVGRQNDGGKGAIGEHGDEDEETDEEKEECDFQKCGDGSDVGRDVPLLPGLEPDLTDEDVLPRGRSDGVPPEVLSAPLLRENSKQRRSKAEYEAEEPKRVDGRHARRHLELGGGGERFGGMVEKVLRTRR